MINKILSAEKIHELGIKWVYKQIKKEFEILSVNINFEENPQIIARKEEQIYFIVVKTSTYPDIGSINPLACEEIIKHADKHKAKILFGMVGIANADTQKETEMDKPQENGHYYFNFADLSIKPNLL